MEQENKPHDNQENQDVPAPESGKQGQASFHTGSTTKGGSNYGQGSHQLGGETYHQGDVENEGSNYDNETGKMGSSALGTDTEGISREGSSEAREGA